MTEEVVRLQDEIARQDRALLELLARRFDLAAQVGRLKAERGQPVIVREVEQQVLLQAREHAESCGVDGGPG
ncbi:MAG: chorismate mutase [Acidobacteria bacterium]|nr:chorismate mutase [Acidobacteriota bacterium]